MTTAKGRSGKKWTHDGVLTNNASLKSPPYPYYCTHT